MDVLIMGGGGAMARGILWDLINNQAVDKIVLADIDLEKAESVATNAGSSKVSAICLDAGNSSKMIEAFNNVDAVANAAWYELNLPIMEACLKAGVNYADLGGLYHVTLEQLKYDAAFQKAGLAAILGIGASSGITNLCAAKALSSFDQLEEIHIRTGAKGGAKGFAYSAKTVIDELTMPPAIYRDHELQFLEPLSGREKYTLPEPVGEVEGFYSIHSELATLPDLADSIKEVTFRVAFSPRLVTIVDSLLALNLLSEDKIDFNGCRISAKDFLHKFLSLLPEPEYSDEFKSLRVETVGVINGKKVTRIYEVVVKSLSEQKLRATSIWTGVPLAVALDLVGRGIVTKKGVFPPEKAGSVNQFFKELAKRNIVITERTV